MTAPQKPASTQQPGRLASLRRWMALILLATWFGGFTLYAAVVVPIGSEVLSKTEQGFVTQRVTVWLNVIGLAMIGGVAWEMGSHLSWRHNKLATSALAIFAAALIALTILHGYLDKQLNSDTMTVLEPNEFYQLHRIYLWLSSLQWLACFGLWWPFIRQNQRPNSESVADRG